MATGNSTCPVTSSASLWAARQNMYYFAYYILPPMVICVALPTNLLGVCALCRQTRENVKYAYQATVWVNRTCEIVLCSTSFICVRRLSGMTGESVGWFVRSYQAMWFTAKLAVPVTNAFSTSIILMALATAADRLFAVASPYRYRTIDHGKHLAFALSTVYALSFSTSVYDAFRYYVANGSNGTYAIAVDLAYVSNPTTIALNNFRESIRIIGIGLLIVCNLAVWRYFIHANVKLTGGRHTEAELAATMVVDANSRLHHRAKRSEKTLLMFSFTESAMVSVCMTMQSVYYVVLYLNPSFLNCEALLLGPVAEAWAQLCLVLSFFIDFAANKPLRNMVLALMPARLQRSINGTVIGVSFTEKTGSQAQKSVVTASTNRHRQQHRHGDTPAQHF